MVTRTQQIFLNC